MYQRVRVCTVHIRAADHRTCLLLQALRSLVALQVIWPAMCRVARDSTATRKATSPQKGGGDVSGATARLASHFPLWSRQVPIAIKFVFMSAALAASRCLLRYVFLCLPHYVSRSTALGLLYVCCPMSVAVCLRSLFAALSVSLIIPLCLLSLSPLIRTLTLACLAHSLSHTHIHVFCARAHICTLSFSHTKGLASGRSTVHTTWRHESRFNDLHGAPKEHAYA